MCWWSASLVHSVVFRYVRMRSGLSRSFTIVVPYRHRIVSFQKLCWILLGSTIQTIGTANRRPQWASGQVNSFL